ncbi:fungal specific transcription factor domain-containing protein [Rutstroemia sp. NJR-2017a BBW]|nr:fungal specific transcription factor domain-containing protein [Rutstroemia sp. NJR-2017a BBW]
MSLYSTKETRGWQEEITGEAHVHPTLSPGHRLPGLSMPAVLSRLPNAALMRSVQAQLDLGVFPRTVFAPLPPKSQITSLLTNALEDVSKAWPLFEVGWILEIIEEQYTGAVDDCHSNPVRWATINATLAIALQWKAANSSIKALFPMSWSYFKNAFSCFPELITQIPSFEACRAVLIMHIFMLGTGDARTGYSILSAAVQLAQVIGLHRKDLHLTLSENKQEEHRRVLCTLYILRVDAAIKYGLPAPFDDREDEVYLSSENAPDITVGSASPVVGMNVLTPMAYLAAIQARVHTHLRRSAGLGQEVIDRLKIASQMDHELERWRAGLPDEIRPTDNAPLNAGELESGVVLLHLAYYTTAWKIHLALQGSISSHGGMPCPRETIFTEGTAWKIPLRSPSPEVGARVTLFLLQKMTLQPLPYLW